MKTLYNMRRFEINVVLTFASLNEHDIELGPPLSLHCILRSINTPGF